MKLIKEIKALGLEKFIEVNNLKMKDYGHKFSLKYDQLKTKKTEATRACRGIVLTRDYEIMSYPLYRFDNYNESSRKDIDWVTATYWEKTDGTLIHYYWDWIADKWCVGTTGTAEAVDLVSTLNKITGERINSDFNLTELFYKTCSKKDVDLKAFNKKFTYVFELATKFNQVVNKYDNDTIKLLAIRDLSTLNEFTQSELDVIAADINCQRVKQYFFDSEDEMLKTLNNVKYGDINFEGYVVVDDNFNRLKVKSNKYIIYSQFNGDITSKWRLVDIIINNEVEEVSSTFPILSDELLQLQKTYKIVIAPIEKTFNVLKENKIEGKEFFIEASKSVNYDKSKKALLKIFSALNKNNNISFFDAINQVDKKRLYKILKNEK